MTNIEKEKFIFNPFKEADIKEEVRIVFYDVITESFSRMEIISAFGELEVAKDEFEHHMQYKYKYQTMVDNRWKDFTKYKYLPLEQETEDGLKYIYYHKQNSPYLIVVFQALNEVPGYNYIGTLGRFPVSKLYIKDDYGFNPTKATYYLGQNKSFDIAHKVNQLIEKARNYNQLEKCKIICAGSSKGGYASIYHSILGDYGYCIAGGPQIFLGKYLGKNLSNSASVLTPIFNYLTGGLDEKDKNWADQIIVNLIDKKQNEGQTEFPTMFIHVGKGEPHYEEHIFPFYNLLKNREINNIYLDLGEYETHEELAKHYPVYLERKVSTIINSLW